MHYIIALQKYHVLGPFGMKFELATNRPTRCWCSCSMGTWNAWIPYAVYHANMWYTIHTLEGITIEFRFCFSGRITPKKRGAKGCKWHLQRQNIFTLLLPFTWSPSDLNHISESLGEEEEGKNVKGDHFWAFCRGKPLERGWDMSWRANGAKPVVTPTFYIFLSILNSPHESFSQKCSTPSRNEVRRTTPPPYCSPATSCATPRPGRCKGVPLGVLTTCVVLPHKYRVFQTLRDKKGHQIALKHILIILAQSWH